MIPQAREVRLKPKIRKVLEARCRAPSTPQSDVKRAKIVLLAAEGLKPSSLGVRVGIDGERRTVHDGPFAETRELVAGFWLWQVRSMDEAVEWARRCPTPHADGGTLEIRPVWEMDDFDAMTAEQRERESQRRAELAGQ